VDLDLGVLGVYPCSSSHIPPYLVFLWWDLRVGDFTSRKQGFGSGLAIPLEPVQPRTGTLGGIRPGSCSQGASRAS
jgi:hypothetical protein